MEKFVKGKGKKNEGEGGVEKGIGDLREIEAHVIKVNLTTNKEVSRKCTAYVFI